MFYTSKYVAIVATMNGDYMLDHGNVVIKISYSKQNAGVGRSAEFHARYIGTRAGTDMTRTEEDMKLDRELEKLREKTDSEVYANYIGHRPGVALAEDVNHGLFDRHGTANMTNVCNELRRLEKSPAIKIIVSLREEDAAAMSISSKSQWETLIRKTMPQVGNALNIPPSRLGWVSAYHPKKGHPHAHVLVWDKADKVRHGVYAAVSKKELNNIKRAIAKEVFSGERAVLYETKNSARSDVRQMALEDVAAVLNGNQIGGIVKPINQYDVWLKDALIEIRKSLPGHGRANYAFMPPNVKARIQEVVDRLIKTPRFSRTVDSYLNAHEAIARNYLKKDENVQNARNTALDELKSRLHNVVLDGALELRNETAIEAIKRNSDKVITTQLPPIEQRRELESSIRCKLEAGESRDEIAKELENVLKEGAHQSIPAGNAHEIADEALKADFNYKDWDNYRRNEHDNTHEGEGAATEREEGDELEEEDIQFTSSINANGFVVYNAVSDMIRTANHAVHTATRRALHEQENIKSGKENPFIGRKIIAQAKHGEGHSMYQDLEHER